MQSQLSPLAAIHDRTAEISQKLTWMRDALQESQAAGLRLCGIDWFAWATAGGSNMVLLAAETGVAEVLVTLDGAWMLTDEIEAQRLQDEEVPSNSDYQWFIHPWANKNDRESFVQKVTQGGKVISDIEGNLPRSLIDHKRMLLPSEIDRYRQVGKLASEAMTEVLNQASPDWTEVKLAGAGAAALWTRGLHPNPETSDRLSKNMAMAWNPSLVGAKIEDTFLLHEDNRLENLTLDPHWKSIEINGWQRPFPLEKL